MSAQVAADLRAAAEVLRRDGWTQGAMETESGERCASGAILAVGEDWLDAVMAASRHVGHTPLYEWNDAPGRTADEVIAALLAAADAAEAQP